MIDSLEILLDVHLERENTSQSSCFLYGAVTRVYGSCINKVGIKNIYSVTSVVGTVATGHIFCAACLLTHFKFTPSLKLCSFL